MRRFRYNFSARNMLLEVYHHEDRTFIPDNMDLLILCRNSGWVEEVEKDKYLLTEAGIKRLKKRTKTFCNIVTFNCHCGHELKASIINKDPKCPKCKIQWTLPQLPVGIIPKVTYVDFFYRERRAETDTEPRKPWWIKK